MTYEISNPSDAYTMQSDDPAAAAVACLFLGEGAYGLTDRNGDQACPIFLLGGDPDAWLKQTHGVSIKEVSENRRDALADALDSVLIGSFRDRDEVDAACAKMAPEAAAQFKAERHDRRRTSLNNIGKRAKSLAEFFRKPRAVTAEPEAIG